MKIIMMLLISANCQAQTYNNKQLSDKMRAVELSIATQKTLNTRLIADTIAKSKRIAALEIDLSAFKKKIDSLTIITDTTTDFRIEQKIPGKRILRIRRQ
jgi:hypothetical protein